MCAHNVHILCALKSADFRAYYVNVYFCAHLCANYVHKMCTYYADLRAHYVHIMCRLGDPHPFNEE
jgi:hypothetical protein